jgi:GT2 family glycosyltransferase
LERVPAASLVAIDTGWPEDVARWRRSVSELNAEVLVAPLDPEAGWAATANKAVELARAEIVILFDPGVEAAGDVAGPLVEALKDPSIAVTGPFGVRGKRSLKEFAAHPGPEVDAIEGYCMAFRKADALAVGGFDRRFRFYRIADIELSFKLRALSGRRALVVPVPVVKHEHRMWEATPDAERQRLSKKNLYRFLDLWRDREDLLVERSEQSGQTQRDQ